MKQKEVKQIAEKFCADYGISDYPVKIIQICNENGLEVFEEYLEPDVSGLIVVDEKPWEKYGTNQFILVNSMESAHFVLHRNGSRLFAHRDMAAEGAVRSSMEQEANYFAANILMPEKLVREKVEDLRDRIWSKIPGFVLVKEIADHFLVSESAAEVRLKQIGIL